MKEGNNNRRSKPECYWPSWQFCGSRASYNAPSWSWVSWVGRRQEKVKDLNPIRRVFKTVVLTIGEETGVKRWVSKRKSSCGSLTKTPIFALRTWRVWRGCPLAKSARSDTSGDWKRNGRGGDTALVKSLEKSKIH